MRTRIGRLLAALALGLVCCCVGCIPVNDFGDQWKAATVDPKLEGAWKKLGTKYRWQDEYLVFRRDGDVYWQRVVSAQVPELPDEPKIEFPVRTLEVGSQKLGVMGVPTVSWVDVPSKPPLAGWLVRYTIVGDTLTIYQAKREALVKAIQSGEVAGGMETLGGLPAPDSMPADMPVPTLTRLDAASLAWLAKFVRNAAAWEEQGRYQHVADLGKAVEESRTYPATPETARRAQVHVALPDLDYFAAGKTNVLLRHFRSSPEWDVVKEGDELIAYETGWEHGKWGQANTGYRSQFLDNNRATQSRLAFRFSEQGGGPFANEPNRSFFTAVAPTAGRVELKLKSSDQGIKSYLAVGRPGLWMEIFDQSWQEDRVLTRQLLLEGWDLLHKVRASERQLEVLGYVPSLMPRGGVRTGEPSLEVEGDQAYYVVTGWVNPQADGMVYLKVIDVSAGRPLSPENVKLTSRGWVGWAPARARLFSYCSVIGLGSELGPMPRRARFELWFQPADGGPETKLVEVTHPVRGWPRGGSGS